MKKSASKTFRRVGAAMAAALMCCSMFMMTACGEPEKGDKGDKGDTGAQGVQGVQGEKGENGATPTIGENGNWWVDGVDTGVYAGTTPDPLKALNETKAPITKEVSGYRYANGRFVPDYDNMSEALKVSRDLSIETAKEGIVLLKNDNETLPLKNGKGVTMLGYRSYNPANGGSGSGAAHVGVYGVPYTDFIQGIEAGGFSINPVVQRIYEKIAGSAKIEPSVEDLKLKDAESSFSRYSDAAIVTIGRTGSEGGDMQYQKVAGHKDETDHILELEDGEEEIIKYAKKHFDKVVVLVNAGCAIELGELQAEKTADNLGVDAILVVGHLGNDGAAALGDILNGSVSPSGKTSDTWARDFTKDPAFTNFGDMKQWADVADNKLYNPDGTELTDAHSVEYREGIYVGYKYYETAYDEMKAKDKAAADKWYNDAVVYPFGYGMSYTDFKWELVGAGQGDITAANETVTLKVKVTNIGDVAGKDVVEMYVNPPYTYGGIEKSSANLMDFAKTDLLQPGQSQVVTLRCVAQDFASFDWNDANENGFKGYELEAGEYIVSANRSAHEEVLEVKRTVKEGIKCATDYTTGNEIEAVFSATEGDMAPFNTVNQALSGNLLSRMDLSTPPESSTKEDRTLTAAEVTAINALNDAAGSKDKETDPWYVKEVPSSWDQGTGTEDENGRYEILLRDMAGVPYEEYKVVDGKVVVGTDEGSKKWEQFLNQLTWDRMVDYVQYGWYGRKEIPEIAKNFEADTDGPMQSGSFLLWIPNRGPGLLYAGTCWVGNVLQCCTWNKELVEKIGEAIGNEALFMNMNGRYGFGMNIHRSPLSGRNFEYFSEDGVLSGKIAAPIIRGASSKGLVCYIKHMFLNEQEADRDTLFTYATEQAIREIYLKPFEMSIKEGHSTAIMTAKNRIGNVSAEANYALSNAIVRDEWNFKGIIITDAYSGFACKNVDAMLRNGTDLPLSGVGKRDNADGKHFIEQNRWDANNKMVYVGAQRYAPAYGETVKQPDSNLTLASPTLYYAVRRSMLHLLYTAANSSGNRNGILDGDKFDESLRLSNSNAVDLGLLGGRVSQAKLVSCVYDPNAEGSKAAPAVDSKTGLPEGFELDFETGSIVGWIPNNSSFKFTITVDCVVDGWVGLTSRMNTEDASHEEVGGKRTPKRLTFTVTLSQSHWVY